MRLFLLIALAFMLPAFGSAESYQPIQTQRQNLLDAIDERGGTYTMQKEETVWDRSFKAGKQGVLIALGLTIFSSVIWVPYLLFIYFKKRKRTLKESVTYFIQSARDWFTQFTQGKKARVFLTGYSTWLCLLICTNSLSFQNVLIFDDYDWKQFWRLALIPPVLIAVLYRVWAWALRGREADSTAKNPLQKMSERLKEDLQAKGLTVSDTKAQDNGEFKATFVPGKTPPKAD